MSEANVHVQSYRVAPVATGAERQERTCTFAPDGVGEIWGDLFRLEEDDVRGQDARFALRAACKLPSQTAGGGPS
jgi:hypothetical protein